MTSSRTPSGYESFYGQLPKRTTIWRLLAVMAVCGAVAAPPVRAGCVPDILGADDQPGQKDVSQLCEPGPTCASNQLSLRWQFDDISWSGSNTGDGCALFDINDDGLADRAVCVTIFGAAKMAGKCSNNAFLGCTKNQDCGSGNTCSFPVNNTGAPRCYTCANDRPTRCTNAQAVACTSVCSVTVVANDPFPGHSATKCSGTSTTSCVTNDANVDCCITAADIGTGGEVIDVCSYPSQQPNSDPSDCIITPPNCTADSDCDDRNPCTQNLCATGTGGTKFCDNPPGNANTECRASTGVCDVAEKCTGTDRDCPADGFAPATTTCRAATDTCDAAENCTGSSATCPTDGFASSSTVCRAAAGPCDVAENCTGSSASCPANAFQPASEVCRSSAGFCDLAENCTGSSAFCPADAFKSADTVCRASAGDCDVAENCTGSTASCPADGFKSADNVCRAAAGDCDIAENCTGSTATCPADDLKSSATVCRAAAGDCDVAENCTGTSTSCPADAFKLSDVVCRPSAGDCDVAEYCPGTGPNCPADEFKPSTVVCRQLFCPGDAAACPTCP